MFDSQNKVVSISVSKFEALKVEESLFLLCFIGDKLQPKNNNTLEACSYYCQIYKCLKCYSIKWKNFKDKGLHGGRKLVNRVLKFQDGNEVACVVGGFSPDLHKLITAMFCEFPNQPSGSQQDNISDSSEKTGTNSSDSSDDNTCQDKQSGKKRKKAKLCQAKKHISENPASSTSTSSALPCLTKCGIVPKILVTEGKNSKLRLSSWKSPESVSNPTKALLCHKSNVQSGGTRSSNSSGRSTPVMPKPPTLSSQSTDYGRILQISPADSLDELLVRIPHRSASNNPDIRSSRTRFVFPSSPTSSTDSIIYSKSSQKQITSQTHNLNLGIEQPRSIISHQPSELRFVTPPPSDHSYIRFLQGPIGGSSSRHITHQRPNQPYHPLSSQINTQRRILPRRRRRTTPIRQTLSSNRLSTPNTRPDGGNDSIL